MTSQKSVALDRTSDPRLATDSDDAEDTKAALYEYVFGRADKENLRSDEAQVIRTARSEVGEIRQTCKAALVGRRLAELGKALLKLK